MPSDKEVMFSPALVCLSAGFRQKNYSSDFTKFGGYSWQHKKLLDFGGNPAHVTAG